MTSPEAVPVIVETASGKLEGAQRAALSVFKGIPFATAKRWQAPERVAAWSGIRSARKAGAMAPQNPTQLAALLGTGGGTFGEDCLSLNVWTPACDGAKRPVMVWIHGGAFIHGGGSQGLYNGKHLAQAGDVVVVTINYRMGAFGFLRLADLAGGVASTGAEGLMDQIAALEWVRENIGAFGGDAGNVTIFGESAGAMSVVSLMASPKAKGLFHKAISQSGGGHLGHARDHATRVAEVFLRHAGLSADAAATAPIELLLKAQLDLLNDVDNLHDPHKLGALAFQPTVDGDVLPVRPIEAIRAGSAAGVPLVAGTTAEEWKLWTAMDADIQAMDEARLERWARRMFGDDAGPLLAVNSGRSTYENYVFMQTQRAFREPTHRLLDAQSKHAPVHDYRFDWTSPILGGAFGACHAIELGFVFGTHKVTGPDQFFGSGEKADAINRAMMAAWASFARGTPKVEARAWPKWSAFNPAMVIFGHADGAAVNGRMLRPATWAALGDDKVGV